MEKKKRENSISGLMDVLYKIDRLLHENKARIDTRRIVIEAGEGYPTATITIELPN